MEFEPMLTPREKSPLPKMSPEEDRTRDAVDSEPKHYQLSYSGPLSHWYDLTGESGDGTPQLLFLRQTHLKVYHLTYFIVCMSIVTTECYSLVPISMAPWSSFKVTGL